MTARATITQSALIRGADENHMRPMWFTGSPVAREDCYHDGVCHDPHDCRA